MQYRLLGDFNGKYRIQRSSLFGWKWIYTPSPLLSSDSEGIWETDDEKKGHALLLELQKQKWVEIERCL